MDLSIAKMKICRIVIGDLQKYRRKAEIYRVNLAKNAACFDRLLQIKSKERYCGKARQ